MAFAEFRNTRQRPGFGGIYKEGYWIWVLNSKHLADRYHIEMPCGQFDTAVQLIKEFGDTSISVYPHS